MRILLSLFLLGILIGSGYAQTDSRAVRGSYSGELFVPKDTGSTTNLPACQGSDISRWTNCFSSQTWSNGDKYLGEFKDGMRNGTS